MHRIARQKPPPVAQLAAVAYSGGGAMVQPSPWSDYELLDNFCIVFVSLVARLNNKILGPWLQLTLRVFCRRLAPSLLK